MARILPVKLLALCAAAVLLSACQSLGGRGDLLTLEAESIGYAQEATGIRQTVESDRTQVRATAAMAETRIALLNGINQQLVSTLSVIVTPTIALVSAPQEALPPSAGTPPPPDSVPSAGGGVQVIKTGTATAINEADGCILNGTTSFSPDAARIYATAEGRNLTVGTRLGAQWYYNNALRYEYEWTVEEAFAELCIWFFIDPSITPFTAGEWSVQLTVDGSPTDTPTTFRIEDMMMDDGA